MKTSTLHIDKPSKGVLALIKKVQLEKEAQQKEMRSNWDTYFPKQ